jgi:hypothetical protein
MLVVSGLGSAVLAAGGFGWSHLPAAAAICILLGDIALVGGGLRLAQERCYRHGGWLKKVGPYLGLIGSGMLMALVALANGRDAYKLTYPHLELGPGAKPVEYPVGDGPADPRAREAYRARWDAKACAGACSTTATRWRPGARRRGPAGPGGSPGWRSSPSAAAGSRPPSGRRGA